MMVEWSRPTHLLHHLTVSILHKGFQKRVTAHLMKLMANYTDPVCLHYPLESRGSSEFIDSFYNQSSAKRENREWKHETLCSSY